MGVFKTWNGEMMKWRNGNAVKKAFELNFMQLAFGFFWVSKGQSSFDFFV